nr:methyltransferase, TIGR04325 family [Methylomonas sp. WSC-6]
MSGLRDWAKDCLPPVLLRGLRQLRGGGIVFKGDYPDWESAAAQCSGYDKDIILDKVLDATRRVKRGEAAFERDSVVFDEFEYAWPVIAGLMWAAARNAGSLNVLDFGGALGSSYFQNRRFLDKLLDFNWNVIEQPHFVQTGKSHIQDERLRFYFTIAECLTENRPNAVLLSSVLQYLEDPATIIKELKAVNPSVVILDRTIVNQSAEHKNYIQTVPASIYSASYPCRSLAESKLIEYFYPEYQLESSFPSLSFPALEKIDSMFKGFLFTKVNE